MDDLDDDDPPRCEDCGCDLETEHHDPDCAVFDDDEDEDLGDIFFSSGGGVDRARAGSDPLVILPVRDAKVGRARRRLIRL